MRERGSVTLARSGRLRVQFGDLVIVVVVDLGAHVQLHWGGVMLVLLAQELEELRVVEHLVEWLRVRVGLGEASEFSEWLLVRLGRGEASKVSEWLQV